MAVFSKRFLCFLSPGCVLAICMLPAGGAVAQVGIPTKTEAWGLQDVKAIDPGFIAAVPAVPGKLVKKGDPLVYLDRERQQYNYDVAKIRSEDNSQMQIAQGELAQKSASVDGLKHSVRRRLASEFDLQRAEGELEVARGKLGLAKMSRKLLEIDLRQAKAALDHRTLCSPIDGVVVAVYKTEGAVVQGTPVVSVADPEKLSVTMLLPLEAAGQLRSGQGIPMRFASGLQRVAQILSINPDPKNPNGMQTVRLMVSNPDSGTAAGSQACQAILPSLPSQFLDRESPPPPVTNGGSTTPTQSPVAGVKNPT